MKGQGVKFFPRNILVNTRINILQWILTKLGTYLVLRRVWMLRGKYLNPWHWKSIGFQNLLRSKYVPSLVKIHWRMLILECSQGCYAVKIWPSIKIEAYTKPNNVWSLRFKLDFFIWRQWRHIGYVPKSSITFRRIFSVFNRMCIYRNTTRDVTTILIVVQK
jgi:hypothetical protein